MSRVLRGVLVVLAVITTISFASGQTDVAGSKDYPGISRMPGYVITQYRESQFDSYSFLVTEAGKEKKQSVEGHLYSFRYDRKKDTPPTSALQVIRNYQNAARSAGGQVPFENGEGGDRGTTIRLVKGGSEVWLALHVIAYGDVYNAVIVERQSMQQEVKIEDAATMAQGIGEAGRVAIYGINFDTGKSELKPESEPALIEIAKLLTQNPALKLYVVGHTDMVADLATNVKLSQARAQSVVNALVTKHAIASARLIPFGNGPYAPVASNKTEEGRAKNRRVELVEIATK
jgi:OOP family OmpA-OmpF porin